MNLVEVEAKDDAVGVKDNPKNWIDGSALVVRLEGKFPGWYALLQRGAYHAPIRFPADLTEAQARECATGICQALTAAAVLEEALHWADLSPEAFDKWCQENEIKLIPHQKKLAEAVLASDLMSFREVASGLSYTFQTVEKFIRR